MEFIFFIFYFIFASFLAFYIPGKVVLGSPKNLPRIAVFAVSFILGIALWGWQGYIFGFLQLRNLSYLYLLVFFLLFLRKKYYLFKIPQIKLRKFDWIMILMFTVGIIAQTFQFIRNGQVTLQGIFLSNNNISDHIWHATVTQELVRRFPPNEPGMYGIPLLNYHFWFNLITADIIRVFHLPLFQTQFIGMYILGPILFALIVYSLATAIYNSKLFLRLVIFFLFFAGDATGWLMLLLHHRLELHTGWLFEDGTKLIDSPGRGFAILIAFAAFYLLFKHKEKMSWKLIVITGLLFGSFFMFNIYIGIPFMFGLLCLSFVNCFKRKFFTLWIFVIACILSLIQFWPFNSSSGGLFLLPFEIPRQFIAQPALGLSFIDQRWTIYMAHHSYFRLAEYGFLMTIVFLLAQFGIKFFGLLPLKKTIRALGSNFYLFLGAIVLSSFILGLFFYQKIGGANIWEFFMVASFILAITVSLNITLYLPKSKHLVYLIIFVIIAFTIPRWVDSVVGYFSADYLSGFHGIKNVELESYNYFKDKTPENSLILVINQKKYVSHSSIVSVLSQRNLFLSGVGGEGSQGNPELASRIEDAGIIKTSPDSKIIEAILKKDNINYIYVNNPFVLPIATISASFKNVFSNDAGKIFKIDYNNVR